MATETPAIALRVSRTIDHPREKVFKAWTETESLAQWFAPSTDYRTVVTTLEPKLQGSYRIEMHHKDGNAHIIAGKYLEFSPPSKLVFTWVWEKPDAENTVVTIELKDKGGSTEMILTHEKFDTADSRDHHEQGWNNLLDRLANALVPSTN